MMGQDHKHAGNLIRRGHFVDAEQDHTGMCLSAQMDQFPEILIFRQQQLPTGCGKPQYLAVLDAMEFLTDGSHLVTSGSQGGNHLPVHAFIGHEVH